MMFPVVVELTCVIADEKIENLSAAAGLWLVRSTTVRKFYVVVDTLAHLR